MGTQWIRQWHAILSLWAWTLSAQMILLPPTGLDAHADVSSVDASGMIAGILACMRVSRDPWHYIHPAKERFEPFQVLHKRIRKVIPSKWPRFC
jgi:hypothetical protein